tara:strand:- start:64 stop:318 length:255 start_codon:yes stop_codon:yes gene_type:complete
MQIKPIASNMTELTFTPKETTAYGDFSVLYSYSTPVAGYSDEGAFRTDKYYSVTTSKHINKYLGGKHIGKVVPQSYIDALVENR